MTSYGYDYKYDYDYDEYYRGGAGTIKYNSDIFGYDKFLCYLPIKYKHVFDDMKKYFDSDR